MRLLIMTQKVDREDSVLGFFHQWIEKLAEKFDVVNVVCLEKGQYSLPANVEVFSLGKENVSKSCERRILTRKNNLSRIRYLFRFFKYVWRLRNDYDAVFVHMNPIYIVLAGIFWKIRKKKVFLWYNHQFGTLITRIGIALADKVFYTSPFSFTSNFKKSKIMPAGIDTDMFSPKLKSKSSKLKNSILYLGRISSIKNLDVLIKATRLLDNQGKDFVLNIVGDAKDEDERYFQKIKKLSQELVAKNKIKFWGNVPNYQTPEIYNQAGLFVNLTNSGSLDKTTLEAMACETLTLVSNKSFKEVLPDFLIFNERDVQDLKNKIINIFNMTQEEKEILAKKLRSYVCQNHSLDDLIEKIVEATT